MIVSLDLKSCKPKLFISIPSINIFPSHSSNILNNANASELFPSMNLYEINKYLKYFFVEIILLPAPVLPTIPVMDSGRIVEFDRPKSLLSNSESHFYAMAKSAGLVE